MTALCSGKICTIFPEKGALNFWKACTIALEYSDRQVLNDFIYKEAVRNAKFVKQLKEQLECEIFLNSEEESAYDIADSIACVFNEYQGNKFDDLWVYVEMMLEYKILTYHDEVEEYEIEGQYGMGKECNIYRQYYINV